MLTHPTIDMLQAMRLSGMARAFEEQLRIPDVSTMSFEDRLGLLVEREATERRNRRLVSRLRTTQATVLLPTRRTFRSRSYN